MYGNNFGHCRGCGQSILWIKTKKGNNMPVNTAILNYKLDPDGKEKIVTPDGDVVTGTTGAKPDEADGVGYISHFATCTEPNKFRRRTG